MDHLHTWTTIFDDDEEVIEDIMTYDRENHLRIEEFYTNIALNYSLTDFKSHFRLFRTTFETVLEKIGLCIVSRTGHPKVNPDKQLAMTLWVLGNQEVYRSVADRFGVSKATLWDCVFNVAFVLQNHVKEYIKWPEQQQIFRNQYKFMAIDNFPGVVGAIDGCHIPISAPSDNPNSYINRKGFYSMVLQGICNHRMKFIDVFAGFCGSVHDSRVWNRSEIKQLIDRNVGLYFPQNTHIIGDSAYPLSTYLLTPYKDNGHLNQIQMNYNRKLSKTRIIIERTFGVLKGRFRKLHFVYMYNSDMIPLLILASCILHNICIDHEDDPFDVDLNNNGDLHNEIHNIFSDAVEKREIIANLIN
ncbi:putative nuclease HARBI1 [Prorops nasuta]|uniref:putative nuclease HARBI1 n=1 Tax=Prorops nasuta TaxID=863751 RepID=UPI0034CF0E76